MPEAEGLAEGKRVDGADGALLLASGLFGLGELKPGDLDGVRSDHTLDTCWSGNNEVI